MTGSRDISQLIEHCEEYECSWFPGFLKATFNSSSIIYWPGIIDRYDKNSILIFNDEFWFLNKKSFTEKDLGNLRDVVVVTSVKQRHDYFMVSGIRSIFCPHMHWYFHAIPMRKLGIRPAKITGDRAFNCLNSRWNSGRLHLIEYLFESHPDLYDTGFITANQMSHYWNHPNMSRDTGYLGFYRRPLKRTRIENNNEEIQGIPVSINVMNFLRICETIPGRISIQIETFPESEKADAFITEKSMIALVTRQIPIIIGYESNYIQHWLSNEGFDIFDDVIDHGYDAESDYFKRIELAIGLNKEWLTGSRKLPDLETRFSHNQDYLLKTWLDRSLFALTESIQSALDHDASD